MSQVTINDETFEGIVGERLIDVARRNAAHVGFLCDGLGLCQVCACRVTEGAEQLSPPTTAEQNWFQSSWLDGGYRLACQTTLQGNGPVSFLSRAEELRRQTLAILSPPDGSSLRESAGQLADHVGRLVLNQVSRFPFNVVGAGSIVLKARPTPQTVMKVVTDGVQVVQRMFGSARQQPEATENWNYSETESWNYSE